MSTNRFKYHCIVLIKTTFIDMEKSDKKMNLMNQSGDILNNASEGVDSTQVEHPYISPVGENEFPIIASSAYYANRYKDQDGHTRYHFTMDLNRIRRCGFNVIDAWMTFGEDNKLFNDMAENAGLKIEAGNTLYYETVNTVQDYMTDCDGLDSITLWSFKDEPSPDDLRDDKVEILIAPYNRIYDIDQAKGKDRMVVTNLLGGLVKGRGMFNFHEKPNIENTDYEEYVSLFEQNFHPGVLSYDLYPIAENAWGIYMSNEAYQNFYGNLIFYACRTYDRSTNCKGRKFWAYVESLTMKAYNENDVLCPRFPKAKEEYMRFEAFSALAFGAQGIKYWTYGDRGPNGREVYYGALMDIDGNLNEAWYGAQKVNLEIHALKDVFLGCKLVEFWFSCKEALNETPQNERNWLTNEEAKKFMYGKNITNNTDRSTIYVKDNGGYNADINGTAIVTTKIRKEVKIGDKSYYKYYKIFLNQDFQNYTEVTFTIGDDTSTLEIYKEIYNIRPNVELAARKFEETKNMGMQIKPVRIQIGRAHV